MLTIQHNGDQSENSITDIMVQFYLWETPDDLSECDCTIHLLHIVIDQLQICRPIRELCGQIYFRSWESQSHRGKHVWTCLEGVGNMSGMSKGMGNMPGMSEDMGNVSEMPVYGWAPKACWWETYVECSQKILPHGNASSLVERFELFPRLINVPAPFVAHFTFFKQN